MLPFKNRLKKEKEIEEVFKKGKSIKEGFFFLKEVKNNLTDSRFCFSIPGNVTKKAVVRNRLKRRMREVVRENLPKIKKGLDIVVIALPGSEKLDFKNIKKGLLKLFSRAKILE
jgi:ribonuclease P protein component